VLRKPTGGLAVVPPELLRRPPDAPPAGAPPGRRTVAAAPPSLQRALSHKRARTLTLGPHMRLAFEDRLTLAHQVRTIARAERITDPVALALEMAAYAPLMPDGRSWRATLLLELPDPHQRERELPLLNEAAHQLYIDVPRLLRVRCEANEDQPDRHRSRLSAVHFLRFGWPDEARHALQRAGTVVLGCNHPRYAWRRLVPAHTLALLRADLAPLPSADDAGSAAHGSSD
jgi:hypothetical protein